MESRLAEVVDKTVIVEVDTELSLCSCESDVVDETCSLGGNDTCGKYRVAFKTSYKTEYRSGIGNERDGFNCGGEQGNL